MEPYQKELLEKLTKQSEENNKILRSLRAHSRYSMFFGLLKWTIILGPLIWAYFYLEPYFGNIRELFETLSSQLQAVGGLQEQLKGVETFLKSTPPLR